MRECDFLSPVARVSTTLHFVSKTRDVGRLTGVVICALKNCSLVIRCNLLQRPWFPVNCVRKSRDTQFKFTLLNYAVDKYIGFTLISPLILTKENNKTRFSYSIAGNLTLNFSRYNTEVKKNAL